MKFFGNRRKTTMPREERMHYSASSFSFAVGDVFHCANSDEVSSLLKDRQGDIVILYPGEDVVNNPRAWVRALSSSSYVIIVSSNKNKALKQFLRLLDAQIFSPLPKALSGSICLSDSTEIKTLAEKLLAEGKHCLTISSRESPGAQMWDERL